MYSNVPSTVSVADVSTVVRMRSSNSSRTIVETSIGEARRKMPFAAKLDEIHEARVGGAHEEAQLVADLTGPARERADDFRLIVRFPRFRPALASLAPSSAKVIRLMSRRSARASVVLAASPSVVPSS